MGVAMSAALIGGATAIGGAVMSSKASGKAADAQASAAAGAQAMDQANLDFNMQQYEDHMSAVADLEEIFGPIKENMANYYNNMSPERYEMMGKESIEKQYQKANDNISAMFSNNGMYGSGQQASAQVALEAAKAESAGENKQNAMTQYNNEQMGWLNFGINEINANKGFASGTAAAASNVMSQSSANQMQAGAAMANIHNQQSTNWGGLSSAGLGMAGYALGSMGKAPVMSGGMPSSMAGGNTSGYHLTTDTGSVDWSNS